MIHPDEVFAGPCMPVAGAGRTLVAYSGGLDSHVLLHLLHIYTGCNSALPKPVAVHVNHGLNPDAGAWAQHCRTVCMQLQVEFHLLVLDARSPKGESQEAWARKLRYEALMRLVQRDDVLMTAHHRDDMAETLLIQLFRGAGPAGLAAMPVQARFGKGRHCRPLLQYSREDLAAYARQHKLVWIEDDSNTDPRYDRNLLRNTVLPVLKQRWPSLSVTLYRAARLQADAAGLLAELAAADMQACTLNEGHGLRVSTLLAMSRVRAANVLRYWIRQCGFPVPQERQLDEIFTSVLQAGTDATPCVEWAGTQLRRYRDCLFISQPLPPAPDSSTRVVWDMNYPCVLVLGTLQAMAGHGEGIRADRCVDRQLEVRFRQGEERLLIGGHRHELRKLFQQYGVAPCYRDYIPLLYSDDTLVAIAGIGIADDWRAEPDQPGWQVNWSASATVRPGGND